MDAGTACQVCVGSPMGSRIAARLISRIKVFLRAKRTKIPLYLRRRRIRGLTVGQGERSDSSEARVTHCRREAIINAKQHYKEFISFIFFYLFHFYFSNIPKLHITKKSRRQVVVGGVGGRSPPNKSEMSGALWATLKRSAIIFIQT